MEDYNHYPKIYENVLLLSLPIVFPIRSEEGLVLMRVNREFVQDTQGLNDLIDEIETNKKTQKYDVMGIMCKYHYNDQCMHGKDCLYIHVDKKYYDDYEIQIDIKRFPKKICHIIKTQYGDIAQKQNIQL